MSSTPPNAPPPPSSSHHHIARNARMGLWLFAIYVIIYAGFVALAAFKPAVMGTMVGGVNVATIYGFGLIVAAFALALVYMVLCGDAEEDGGKAS